MRHQRVLLSGIAVLIWLGAFFPFPAAAQSLAEQNEALFRELQQVHSLSDGQMQSIRKIFSGSGYIGQGNPAVTRHPVSPQGCREKLAKLGVRYENAEFEKICGARFMAPLYDPARQKAQDAGACIDQFEFPNIPCAYPVIWVRAREAAEICQVMGKRLCDAHEWEGACAGALEPPDYRFDLARGVDANTAVGRMRQAHNKAHATGKAWAYGPSYQKGICAAASIKTAGCGGGGWGTCGSNTYPAGTFPDCHSALRVYDQHGNAAEHMNLPLSESQMSSRGSRELGVTEMKGSWFIFDTYHAHEDWCRWRAPFWHGTRVMDAHSHANYHLGFRCCKTIGKD
jgi:hypothetical protein